MAEKFALAVLGVWIYLFIAAPVLATNDENSSLLTREEFDRWEELPEYTIFNPFPSKGANCTWYAHGRMIQLGYCKYALDSMRFSAHTWAEFANRGAAVLDEPEAGAIAFWDGSASFGGSLGHVGVVEAIKDDGSILISDSSSSRSAYNVFTADPDGRKWPTAFIVVPEAPERSKEFNPGDKVQTTPGNLNFRLEGLNQSPELLSQGTEARIEEHPSNGLYASRPGSIEDYYHWWYAAVELDGELEFGWLAEDYLETAGEDTSEEVPEPGNGDQEESGKDGDPDEDTSLDEEPEDEEKDDLNDNGEADPDCDTDTDTDSEPDNHEDPDDGEVLDYKPGDVNGDGVVDVRDAVLSMQNALKIKQLDEVGLAAADVNNDGEVDVRDVVLIIRYALEIIPSFEEM